MSSLLDTSYTHRRSIVQTQATVSRQCHVLQAYKRAIWTKLYQNGIVAGRRSKDTVVELDDFDWVLQTHWTPFLSRAAELLVDYGYFAVVYETVSDPERGYETEVPICLDPTAYILYSTRLIKYLWPSELENRDPDNTHHVIYTRTMEYELYRDQEPRVFVMYPPTDNGELTNPAGQIWGDHDARTIFMTYAMAAEAVNSKTRAWTVEKFDEAHGGVLSAAQRIPTAGVPLTNMFPNIPYAIERQAAYLTKANQEMYQRFREGLPRPEPTEMPKIYGNTAMTTPLKVDANQDPTALLSTPPNVDIVTIPELKPRTDLVAIISMLERQIAITLGIHPAMLGMDMKDNGSNEWAAISAQLWNDNIRPLQDTLNLALKSIVDHVINLPSSVAFKKTGEKRFAMPAFVEFGTARSRESMTELMPFMKFSAWAEYTARFNGLEPTDFDESRFLRNSDINPPPEPKTTK